MLRPGCKVPDLRQCAERFGRLLRQFGTHCQPAPRITPFKSISFGESAAPPIGNPYAFCPAIMLNQFKTIETNPRARLETRRTLRRVDRLSEKPEPRAPQRREEPSASLLPPDNVYFTIELA